MGAVTENKTRFLSNGEEVLLHQELSENEFIVEKYIQQLIVDEYGDEIDEDWVLSGQKIVVDKVYEKVPVFKIDEEYQSKERTLKAISDTIVAKQFELTDLRTQCNKLESEIRNQEREKVDLQRLIFDGSRFAKAKTAAFFISYSLKPVTVSVLNGIKLSFNLEFRYGKPQVKIWGYCVHEDFGQGPSHYLAEGSEIYLDKTEEELIEIAIQRASEMEEIPDSMLRNTPDQYLSVDLLARKQEIQKRDKEKQVEKVKVDIEKLQNKLAELTEDNHEESK